MAAIKGDTRSVDNGSYGSLEGSRFSESRLWAPLPGTSLPMNRYGAFVVVVFRLLVEASRWEAELTQYGS